MPLVFKVDPGESIKLKDIDPDHDGGLKKSQGEQRLKDLAAELSEIQSLLAAAATQSVLIVLQGMDTSGKDGTVRGVLHEVNETGCRVESFKVPTPEELAHDFLWRVHQKTPAHGMLTVFNRSHYEDVLVARVHELASEERIDQRYDQINHFERLLTQNDTIVLKFFLHISKDEQEKRLLAREQDVTKAWKLAVGDWKERVYWDDYQRAYAIALNRCSTRYAPWYIVPANRKWFRNLAIADTIVSQLRPYKKQWLAKLQRQSEQSLADVRAWRTRHKKGDAPSADATSDAPSADEHAPPLPADDVQTHTPEAAAEPTAPVETSTPPVPNESPAAPISDESPPVPDKPPIAFTPASDEPPPAPDELPSINLADEEHALHPRD